TLFNKLMEEGTDNIPPPTKVKVSDILAAFLKHAAETTAQRTFEWYKAFLVTFGDLYGALKPHQVTGDIVDAWLNAHPDWKGCRRGRYSSTRTARRGRETPSAAASVAFARRSSSAATWSRTCIVMRWRPICWSPGRASPRLRRSSATRTRT